MSCNWDNIFLQTGDACDPARIAEIERAIGFELPEAYRQVIAGCGGGVFEPDVGELFDDEELGCAVEELYGNVAEGTTDDHLSLNNYARHLMDTWDLPSWGYLIALGDGEIHTPILLNRDNPAYPQGALVCVDLEVEEETMIAESFDAFWQMITANVNDPDAPKPPRP